MIERMNPSYPGFEELDVKAEHGFTKKFAPLIIAYLVFRATGFVFGIIDSSSGTDLTTFLILMLGIGVAYSYSRSFTVMFRNAIRKYRLRDVYDRDVPSIASRQSSQPSHAFAEAETSTSKTNSELIWAAVKYLLLAMAAQIVFFLAFDQLQTTNDLSQVAEIYEENENTFPVLFAIFSPLLAAYIFILSSLSSSPIESIIILGAVGIPALIASISVEATSRLLSRLLCQAIISLSNSIDQTNLVSTLTKYARSPDDLSSSEVAAAFILLFISLIFGGVELTIWFYL